LEAGACGQFNPERILASISIVFVLKLVKYLCDYPDFSSSTLKKSAQNTQMTQLSIRPNRKDKK